MALSLVYVFGLVVFALATLPVELETSKNALRLIERTRLADDEEVGEVRRVLRAAAFTYGAGPLPPGRVLRRADPALGGDESGDGVTVVVGGRRLRLELGHEHL